MPIILEKLQLKEIELMVEVWFNDAERIIDFESKVLYRETYDNMVVLEQVEIDAMAAVDSDNLREDVAWSFHWQTGKHVEMRDTFKKVGDQWVLDGKEYNIDFILK